MGEMSTKQRIDIIKRDALHWDLKSLPKVFSTGIDGIEKNQFYIISSEKDLSQEILKEVFIDPVLDCDPFAPRETHEYHYVIETTFRAGVTDNPARVAKEALSLKTSGNTRLEVASGEIFFLKGELEPQKVQELAENYLANPLIQSIKIIPALDWPAERKKLNSMAQVKITPERLQTYDLNLENGKLERLSNEKCWALSVHELQQIHKHFVAQKEIRTNLGLPALPTDVEIEVFAQTWSEHCKHKIFAAEIEYSEKSAPGYHEIENKKVKSLYKTYIQKATKEVKKKFKIDWLISVFSDNAGIVRFGDKNDVCIKVETHNSPSALDPYGGALTGILGVNRDILGCGLGAKPIANTNVLCFASAEELAEKEAQLPEQLKDPEVIMRGVHKGIEDGGNKSGIPTVNGAIIFDDDFAGKPLVYCGTLGILPQKTKSGRKTSEKYHEPGHAIFMVGGAIGVDGIHGATFSSMELTEEAPATAVQIGDPLTQKRVLDFIIAARDAELYTSLTDNGAGGLSSSVGEMAIKTNGAVIDLKKAPTKYPGLSPYELMISESQERMTIAVAPENEEAFLKMASEYGVSATNIGNFTDDGYLKVLYGEEVVAYLNLDFLHNGAESLKLQAHWKGPQARKYWHRKRTSGKKTPLNLQKDALALLSHPTIRSKEPWVRKYDHEVQGATVMKPFCGVDSSAPSDSGVVSLEQYGETNKGIAIGSGLCPERSHEDTYIMTKHAIDEAVRNILCAGADPCKVALVDNFCWPDPIESSKNPDGKHKLAQLVRSCEGLYDLSCEYGMPFVSGKDSMKNDFYTEEVKISVPPTLLITAIGEVPDTKKIIGSNFKQVGDTIYLITQRDFHERQESFFSRLKGLETQPNNTFHGEDNIVLYHKIHYALQNNLLQSIHDVSDGGSFVAIVESLLGSSYGATCLYPSEFDFMATMFNEPEASFIVSVSDDKKKLFEKNFSGSERITLGKITERKILTIYSKTDVWEWSTEELKQAWQKK